MATALVISIGNKMASRFKTMTPEEVTELTEAAENLNTRKGTINWLRDFKKWCDENSFEKKKKKQEMILFDQLDKVLERLYASEFKQVDGTKFVTHDIMNGFLVKLGDNFTRHHLITHANH